MNLLYLLLSLIKSHAERPSPPVSSLSPGPGRMVCRDGNLGKGRLVFPPLWLPSKPARPCRWHRLLVARWLQNHLSWSLPFWATPGFCSGHLVLWPWGSRLLSASGVGQYSSWPWGRQPPGEACRPAICLWIFTEGNGSVSKNTGKHMGILWDLEGIVVLCIV